MQRDFLFAIWFLLPAGLANVAPILVAKLPLLKDWNSPMDGGREFRGKPLLGPHKTWRGFVSGIVFATAVFYLQQRLVAHFDWAQWLVGDVRYQDLPAILMGPLFAIGALGGDAVESFFKRRRGIESGEAWLVFDQLDYVIGAVILTLPAVLLPLTEYVWIGAVWFLLHLAASYAGWLMKLKEKPI